MLSRPACVSAAAFFSSSSSELWDATLGIWVSRCRSQPFDVHAAWLPDGKHFVTGLGIEWDES